MTAAETMLVLMAAVVAVAASSFSEAAGSLCIASSFTETHSEAQSQRHCAQLCDNRDRCQAFSVSDGPCRLFVFDRCSKAVRDSCSCGRTGSVFVKRQPGLPEGALCPAGFGDSLCGTSYKLVGGVTNWSSGKAAVDSLPGLVIMADVTDMAELAHLKSLLQKYSWTYVMLGSQQLPGSAEPAGGWFWTACSISINASLWSTGEPNNANNNENTVVLTQSLLKDDKESYSGYAGALAECVSPLV